MRTEKQMLDLVLQYAEQDDRIRVVGMNGSRTNKNVPKDQFQDYDIVYVVTEMDSFIKDDYWIDYFGPRILLQKPEAMSLYPPELGNWFSYLILLEDGIKIDLILIPIDELQLYLADDKLIVILMDKDNRISPFPEPTDIDYHVKMPSEAFFHDCCNEFWWVTTYVAKGLLRKEILFAIDHLNIVRNELLRMISWKVGIETNFSLSIGKNYKYLDQFVDEDLWTELLSTYNNCTYDDCWESLNMCISLYRRVASFVADYYNYQYSTEEDDNVTSYIQKLKLENNE